MAIINFGGFELNGFGGATSESVNYSEGNSSSSLVNTIVTSPVNPGGGSYACKHNADAGSNGTITFGRPVAGTGLSSQAYTASTAYFRFYFYVELAPASGEEVFFSANSTYRVFLTSARQIKFNGSTGASVLALNTWYCIEFMWREAAGTKDWEIRVNGATELSGNISTTTTAECILGKAVDTSNQAITFYYDDICIRDDTWCGAGRSVLLRPIGAGTYSEWTKGTGSTYTEVDDWPGDNDGDTTFVGTSTQNNRFSVNCENCADKGVRGTIWAVKAMAVARDVINTTNHCLGFRSNGSDDYLTAVDGNGSYQFFNQVYNTASGGTTWTQALVDAAEPIIQHQQPQSRSLRCTAMGMTVEFTPRSLARFHRPTRFWTRKF